MPPVCVQVYVTLPVKLDEPVKVTGVFSATLPGPEILTVGAGGGVVGLGVGVTGITIDPPPPPPQAERNNSAAIPIHKLRIDNDVTFIVHLVLAYTMLMPHQSLLVGL